MELVGYGFRAGSAKNPFKVINFIIQVSSDSSKTNARKAFKGGRFGHPRHARRKRGKLTCCVRCPPLQSSTVFYDRLRKSNDFPKSETAKRNKRLICSDQLCVIQAPVFYTTALYLSLLYIIRRLRRESLWITPLSPKAMLWSMST